MRVRQLIKKLEKCKPSSSVYVAKLESGCSGYNILKAITTESLNFAPNMRKGREVVALINLDSMPFLEINRKLKVVK
jgi:hypothetical protein